MSLGPPPERRAVVQGRPGDEANREWDHAPDHGVAGSAPPPTGARRVRCRARARAGSEAMTRSLFAFWPEGARVGSASSGCPCGVASWRARAAWLAVVLLGLAVPMLIVWSVDHPAQLDAPNHVARHYLEPIRRAGVDTLVLGCTHYPLLTAAIAFVMGEEVTLVSSAEETAKDTYRSLLSRNLARPASAGPPQHRFAVTGDPVAFRRLARRFLGPEVGHVHASDELGVQT